MINYTEKYKLLILLISVLSLLISSYFYNGPHAKRPIYYEFEVCMLDCNGRHCMIIFKATTEIWFRALIRSHLSGSRV